MRVKELCEVLNTCDQEKEVFFITDDDGFCVAEKIKTLIEGKDRVSLY